MSVSTKIFSCRPGSYVRIVAGILLNRYWWAIALPPLCCLILGCIYGIAFFIVALMLLFLIYPMGSLLVYYNYALTTEAAKEVQPHRIKLNDDGSLDIERYRRTDNSDGSVQLVPAGTEHIGCTEIDYYTADGKNTVIRLKGKGIRLIIIPDDAAGTDFHKRLSENLPYIADKNLTEFNQ